MKCFIFFLLCVALTQADFLSPTLKDDDPVEQTQQIFNGFWAEANLTEPTDLAQTCFGYNTSQLFINTLKEALADLAVNNVVKALKAANAFFNQAPPEVHTCMNDSPYAKEAYEAYGVANLTVAQMSSRVGTYIITHLEKVHQEVVNANNDIQAGNYFQFGQDGGKFALEVFNSSSLVDSSFTYNVKI